MFIFQMNMNCGNTSANVTEVTSNMQVTIFNYITFDLTEWTQKKTEASNLYFNLVVFMPSSNVLCTAVT